MHDAHAATTAATGGLDDHRVADLAGDRQGGFLVFRQRAVGARNGRDAGALHGVLGGHLVAHQADHIGGRADEGEARALDLLGEVGVLGQEAVTRVNAIGTGDFSGGDDRRDVQVGLAGRGRADAHRFVGQRQMHQLAIGGGVNGHRLDPELLARAQDAQRDFATVGDQHFFQHRELPVPQAMVNIGWSNSTG
ncbi:hypothetical protein D9M70_238010 [compost metagenome]